MLDVKISGSPEEIAALFAQLGSGARTFNIATTGNDVAIAGDMVRVKPASAIAADDLPDAGTEVKAPQPTGMDVFGSAAPAPVPGPEVFGAAPSTVAAAPAPTAHAAPQPTSTASGPAPVPPAPPTVNASAAAAPAPLNPAPGVELDKNGLPWDARIHSGAQNDDGSRKKNQDGSWSARRNVSDATRLEVEAQLRALMAHGAPAATPAPAAAMPPAPPPPPPAVVTHAPAPPAGGVTIEFGQLFERATAAIAGGTITKEQLDTMLTRITGSAVLPMAINRPDLWPVLDQNFAAMGF